MQVVLEETAARTIVFLTQSLITQMLRDEPQETRAILFPRSRMRVCAKREPVRRMISFVQERMI